MPLRIDTLRDDKKELPEHFLGEIYKWALECEYLKTISLLLHTLTLRLLMPHIYIYIYIYIYIWRTYS